VAWVRPSSGRFEDGNEALFYVERGEVLHG
jgi:hypothetical protein